MKAFSKKQLAEIAEVARQVQTGTLPNNRLTGRSGVEQLQRDLFSNQLILRSWKPSPVNHRGYLYKPDCAGDLLLQCRAIRRVFSLAGVPLVKYRPTDYNWR